VAFDNVPWAVNGAIHNADLMRSMLYSQTGGAEGITLPGDFKVTALPVPGAAVRIAPGGGTILNKYPGGAGQSYSVRAGTATDVPVPATGSGGGAVRYLIVRIDDPQYGGQGADGQYDYPTLVSSITGLDYPFIPLAKIDQPANTATITAAMITDLREVARPRRWTEQRALALTAPTTEVLTSTGTYDGGGGQTWPLAAEAAWGEIPIPYWAARARVKMTWSQINAPGGDIWGFVWVQLAPTANANHRKTQAVLYDSTGVANKSRMTIVATDDIAVPAALRGTRQKIYPRGNVLGGNNAARFILDSGSAMNLQIEFYEQAN
jgi:hypothetical protein